MCRVILDVNTSSGRPSAHRTHMGVVVTSCDRVVGARYAADRDGPPASPEGPASSTRTWRGACVSIEGAPSLMLDVLHAVLVAPFKTCGVRQRFSQVLSARFRRAMYSLAGARGSCSSQGLGCSTSPRA